LTFLLSFLAGEALFQAFRFFPFLAASLSLALFLFLGLKKKSLLAAGLLALGFMYAFARHSPDAPPEETYGVRYVSGCFVSPEVARPGGYSQRFRVSGGLAVESLDVLSGRTFRVGDCHRLTLRAYVSGGRKNPGSRAPAPYGVMVSAEETGRAKPSPALYISGMRQKLNAFMRERFEPGAASFLMAIIAGHRGEMPPEVRDAFRATGLAHLLSISGTHFGLFGLLCFGLIRAFLRRLPRLPLERLTAHFTPGEAAALLTLPFTVFYLGLSGASVPAARAFVMTGLFLAGLLAGRKGHWLNFLVMAAVLLTLWEPDVLTSLSFQLSFIAVLFIGAAVKGRPPGPALEDEGKDGRPVSPAWLGGLSRFSGKEGGLLHRILLAPAGFLTKSLLITLAALAGVTPLVAYHFHYLPLVSPAANLVVSPLVGFLLVPCALLGSLSYLLAGIFITAPLVEHLARATLWLTRAFASVPHASAGVPAFPAALVVFYYAGIVLWYVLGKKRLLLISLVPALFFIGIALFSGRPLSVTFLDAGRADSAVVELPDGKTLVVDTARSGREAAGYLRTRGISKIDALVLTHGHRDHTGGAGRIAREFGAREIWDAGLLRYPEGFAPAAARRALRRGDVIRGEGYAIHVLHPHPGFFTAADDEDSSMNNFSLVLRIEGRGGSFLLCGDIEDEAVHDLLHLGAALGADVLKVPHHGMDADVMEALLGAVSPEMAVISAPAPRAKNPPAAGTARVFVTGEAGAVRIEAGGKGLSAKPYGESLLKETHGIGEEMRNIRRLFTVW